MRAFTPRTQSGAVLVVSMIMLVLVTLMIVTALNLGTTNFRATSNMQFRSEAIRAGFAQAWQQHDYATIVKVAERLPEQVLQEDPDLLMYYDNASLRVG